MGVIKQGILGGFSGKVANVVGSSWKGIAYMKSLPLSVANPRTAAQVAQRTRMTNCVFFAKIILASIIKPLRDRFAVQQSGYNTFVSDNVALFDAVDPSPAADLNIASGKMAATPIATISGVAAQKQVDFTWADDSGTGFKLADDKAYLVAVNEGNSEVGFDGAAADRDDTGGSVTFAADLTAADTINGYLVFLRVDGTIVSDTSFNTYDVA